jgi:flagellar L-ring protein precursor FlgH
MRQKRLAAILACLAISTAVRAQGVFSPGSLYSSSARLSDLGHDLRAAHLDDIITIVVADRASALARGGTTSNRTSSASTSIGSLLGPTRTAGPLARLIGAESSQQLEGQGETTRETVLTTTLSARVIHVLPNGNMVVEGTKEILVNSEKQVIRVRGVVRWNDLGAANRVSSDRLADLEIDVQGKGVVGDAIRRPNFLYRLLLGLLPF